MRLASLHTYPVKGCYRVDQSAATVEPWGLRGDRRWLVVDPDGTPVTQRECPAMTGVRPAYQPGGPLHLRATGQELPDLPVAEPVGGALVTAPVWGTPVAGRAAGGSADEWLSTALARPVRLLWLDDPASRRPVDPRYAEPADRVSFADAMPLLVTNQASLAALNGWVRESTGASEPLPMSRFRPSVVVTGAEAWAEDDWLGRRLRIGTTVLRVVKPCGRCVVTTTDQETGERGAEPLRSLARHRTVDQKLLFGVLAIPERTPGADAVGQIAVGDEVSVLT